MKKILITLLMVAGLSVEAATIPVKDASQPAKALEIIESLKDAGGSLGDRMVTAAKALEGAGTDNYYLTDSVGVLRVNLDSFTPLMFVNNVIALAKASERPGTTDIGVFDNEFVDIACRRGEDHGFPSVMYHTADWIGDNSARGNIEELTENHSGVIARTKSLDEMTRKRSEFAALADSATFETVRMTEMGFRTHRIPTLKKETIKKKEVIEDLRNGDILILVPSRDGIDVYDMGIVAFEDGIPRLIHLSPHSHTVTEETDDLARYMNLMTKYFQGYRILRVKE